MTSVSVQLVPVTEEQWQTFEEAARTLQFLAYLTGRPEHKAQADVVSRFGSYRGSRYPMFELPVKP